jgi:glycerophosphoryl diester phosphodiesterase
MKGFELQGHRGARGLFPENTLDGFVQAIAFGLDSIELDIAVTSDGVAVVVHDPILNPDLVRLADGSWLEGEGAPIRTLSLAQVQAFDVGRIRPGSALALAHPDQIPRDGARIPTLAEVFKVTQGSDVRVDAELKTDPARPELTVSPEAMAELVVEIARSAGALGRLAIRSFDWRGLDHLRRTHPAVPLAWLTGHEQDSNTPNLVAKSAFGCPFVPTWAPFHGTLDRPSLDLAHRLGLRVVPWTVNETGDMARLIDWGVDGLCTDRPDRAAPLRPPT